VKPARFHPGAEAEMINAAAHYEGQQPALGRRFLATVQDAVNRIVLDPYLYPAIENDVRRCLTKTFPFGVLYRTLPEGIIIIAIMHLHRDPDYWKKRMDYIQSG